MYKKYKKWGIETQGRTQKGGDFMALDLGLLLHQNFIVDHHLADKQQPCLQVKKSWRTWKAGVGPRWPGLICAIKMKKMVILGIVYILSIPHSQNLGMWIPSNNKKDWNKWNCGMFHSPLKTMDSRKDNWWNMPKCIPSNGYIWKWAIPPMK